MLCPLLMNLVRQILLENLLSDVASVPMVPQQILKIWQSYRLTKKRECVARGQRQILPNQIEGPRKFNDIFQEKKIWASIASWNNLEEYFNKPIWGSCGGKPIFLTGQQTLLSFISYKAMALMSWDAAWKESESEKSIGRLREKTKELADLSLGKRFLPHRCWLSEISRHNQHQKARILPSQEVDLEKGCLQIRKLYFTPKVY